MEIKSVGIIGSGQMGSGIAHVVTLAGMTARLYDVSEDRTQKGVARVEKGRARQLSSEKISEADRDAALSRLETSTDLATLKDLDLVIEQAPGSHNISPAATEQTQVVRVAKIVSPAALHDAVQRREQCHSTIDLIEDFPF